MDFGVRARSGVADAREGILRQPDTGGAARIRALQDSFREAAGLKAEEEQALSVPMEETAAASSANVLETPDMRAEEETALQARVETLTPEEEETVRNLAEEIEREVTTLRMASAGITYADLMPGTDLLYDVTGKSLKESLVLDALPGTASYTFLLECATLTAVLNSDRSVTLADAAGGGRARDRSAPICGTRRGKKAPILRFRWKRRREDTATPSHPTGNGWRRRSGSIP